MKLKIDSVDVLQLAKALKSGWLDTDKVESLKSLVEGYNPPKTVNNQELAYYLDCLYKGWGYKPTDKGTIKEMILQGLDGELLEKWQKSIEDNTVYRMMVKDAFLGLVAVKALGGTFEAVEADFSFMNGNPPNFQD